MIILVTNIIDIIPFCKKCCSTNKPVTLRMCGLVWQHTQSWTLLLPRVSIPLLNYKKKIFELHSQMSQVTHPAMHVQWAQTISPSDFTIIHDSFAASGDRWLGFTLAFNHHILLPKMIKSERVHSPDISCLKIPIGIHLLPRKQLLLCVNPRPRHEVGEYVTELCSWPVSQAVIKSAVVLRQKWIILNR